MLANMQYPKILYAVVLRIAVDMVDLFVSLKLSAKVGFHDPSMYKHPLAVYRHHFVWPASFDAHRYAVAFRRAKTLCLLSRGWALEYSATLIACLLKSGVVMRWLASYCEKPWNLNRWEPRFCQATSRAKLGRVSPVCGGMERGRAMSASDVWHGSSMTEKQAMAMDMDMGAL